METLIRYGEPSKLDQAPHGTRCKVNIEAGKFELFIQISTDIEHPTWESLGIFSEEAHQENIDTIVEQRLSTHI